MDSQLKRGLIEVMILALLKKEDSYGYKLIKDISVCMEISESTLYPILKRLEQNGQLSVYTIEHNGRLRKYYCVTKDGLIRITDFLVEWEDVMRVYRFIESGVL